MKNIEVFIFDLINIGAIFLILNAVDYLFRWNIVPNSFTSIGNFSCYRAFCKKEIKGYDYGEHYNLH